MGSEDYQAVSRPKVISVLKKSFGALVAPGGRYLTVDNIHQVLQPFGLTEDGDIIDLIREAHLTENGKICYDDFDKVLLKRLEALDEPVDECIRNAFNLLDYDKNGYITIPELFHLFGEVGEMWSDQDLYEVVKAGDIDGDGRLDLEDFFKFLGYNLTPREESEALSEDTGSKWPPAIEKVQEQAASENQTLRPKSARVSEGESLLTVVREAEEAGLLRYTQRGTQRKYPLGRMSTQDELPQLLLRADSRSPGRRHRSNSLFPTVHTPLHLQTGSVRPRPRSSSSAFVSGSFVDLPQQRRKDRRSSLECSTLSSIINVRRLETELKLNSNKKAPVAHVCPKTPAASRRGSVADRARLLTDSESSQSELNKGLTDKMTDSTEDDEENAKTGKIRDVCVIKFSDTGKDGYTTDESETIQESVADTEKVELVSVESDKESLISTESEKENKEVVCFENKPSVELKGGVLTDFPREFLHVEDDRSSAEQIFPATNRGTSDTGFSTTSPSLSIKHESLEADSGSDIQTGDHIAAGPQSNSHHWYSEEVDEHTSVKHVAVSGHGSISGLASEGHDTTDGLPHLSDSHGTRPALDCPVLSDSNLSVHGTQSPSPPGTPRWGDSFISMTSPETDSSLGSEVGVSKQSNKSSTQSQKVQRYFDIREFAKHVEDTLQKKLDVDLSDMLRERDEINPDYTADPLDYLTHGNDRPKFRKEVHVPPKDHAGYTTRVKNRSVTRTTNDSTPDSGFAEQTVGSLVRRIDEKLTPRKSFFVAQEKKSDTEVTVPPVTAVTQRGLGRPFRQRKLGVLPYRGKATTTDVATHSSRLYKQSSQGKCMGMGLILPGYQSAKRCVEDRGRCRFSSAPDTSTTAKDSAFASRSQQYGDKGSQTATFCRQLNLTLAKPKSAGNSLLRYQSLSRSMIQGRQLQPTGDKQVNQRVHSQPRTVRRSVIELQLPDHVTTKPKPKKLSLFSSLPNRLGQFYCR